MPVGLVSIVFVMPTKAQHFPKEFDTNFKKSLVIHV